MLCISSIAVNLRGMVRKYNSYTNLYYPFPGMVVTIWIGQTHVSAYTDNYGMYYFNNIPPGNWPIQVGIAPNNFNFYFLVDGRYALQDIPVTTL
jgi:hypothetical protein